MSAPGDRVLCVSVDLDGLAHYHDIHGLAPPQASGADAVYTVALPRFVELFAELGVRATFFAIGECLGHPAAAEALARAHDAGHEIANHTYSHRYDLVHLADDEVVREVERGHEAIARATGARCVGFRAPGYNIDARVLDACRALHYTYDSSVFPSVPYYLAKAAIMGALRMIGRPSRAHLGDPRVLAAPTGPYAPDPVAWSRAGPRGDRDALVELPITLVPGVRFPFIGTWICLWRDATFDAAWALTRVATRFVNLELHGIELLGVEEDSIAPALRRQPDLRVPLHEKRRKLARALSVILRTHAPMPLHEAAAAFDG